MSVGTKIDEKHVNKSDRGILFLDTDVGETNTEDVDLFDELPTPGNLTFSIKYCNPADQT